MNKNKNNTKKHKKQSINQYPAIIPNQYMNPIIYQPIVIPQPVIMHQTRRGKNMSPINPQYTQHYNNVNNEYDDEDNEQDEDNEENEDDCDDNNEDDDVEDNGDDIDGENDNDEEKNVNNKPFKSLKSFTRLDKNKINNELGSKGSTTNGKSIPGFIKIDIFDEENKSGPKQLEDIFKAILGISLSENHEDESNNEFKLKIRDFDMNAEYEEIQNKITSIDDLIKLSELYNIEKPELMKKYTIDLKKLVDMKEPLIELKNMIGMENVKKSVVRQILYFLQGIEEQQDMLHMVITGSPGTGKTSLGVILSRLYYSMGLLNKKTSINPITGKKEDFVFKIYKRADLVGQYLGHTAIKTQKAIDECLGGVMFLDEAYSLGHDEKSDIYTKECVDTINQNLSENKKNFILIIAGYAEQLDKCFFSHNEGLKRRFAFRYHIDKYTSEELAKMLELKINLNKWKLDESVKISNIVDLINGSEDMFKNFGGDIESWLLHIKIEHGVRIFGKHPKYRRILTLNDLKYGLQHFKTAKEDKQTREKNQSEKQMLETLYL